MKIRFIVNPIAGGKDKTDEITDSVSRVYSGTRGIFEVRAARLQGDASSLSKEAVEKGYETVFACGGDSTINEVASALVNSKTTLGIVPIGSGNALARALGVPFDIESALGVTINGKIREIDAGSVCDRFFFSTAGIGIDAVISKKYNEREAPRLNRGAGRGILSYLPLALMGYFSYSAEDVLIKYDGSFMKSAPLFLAVANTGEYGVKAIIAPDARLDDGMFDVCVVEDKGFFNAISFALKLFNGKNLNTLKNFRHVRASSVELVKNTPGIMCLDGEIIWCGENLTFTMLPRALKVWTL